MSTYRTNEGDFTDYFLLSVAMLVVSHYLLPLLLTDHSILTNVTVETHNITLELKDKHLQKKKKK